MSLVIKTDIIDSFVFFSSSTFLWMPLIFILYVAFELFLLLGDIYFNVLHSTFLSQQQFNETIFEYVVITIFR